MGSASHTLKFPVVNGEVQAPTMASEEGALLGKLKTQKAKEEAAINDPATSASELANAKSRKSDIEGIEAWFQAELVKIRTAPDKTKIRSLIQALADALKGKIVDFGKAWHLNDLVYSTIGVVDLQEKIQGQVDQLRKHIADARARKPGVTGDGHSNSACAAEAYGWVHPSGALHRDRAVDAERILQDSLNQLDALEKKHGVTLTSLPEYIDAKTELADTKLALSDPKTYLLSKSWDGKPLWDAFFPGRTPPP